MPTALDNGRLAPRRWLAAIAVMTKAGHSDMKTTKNYLHLAGVVFRDEAEALERRLLGEVSTGVSTDLSESEITEQT
jgi:hypothetical protein